MSTGPPRSVSGAVSGQPALRSSLGVVVVVGSHQAPSSLQGGRVSGGPEEEDPISNTEAAWPQCS